MSYRKEKRLNLGKMRRNPVTEAIYGKENFERAEIREGERFNVLNAAESLSKGVLLKKADSLSGSMIRPTGDLIYGIMLKDLSGRLLREDLGLKNAIKRYHNRHKDGSGNFGFTLVTERDKWFTLDGNYDESEQIMSLKIADYSGERQLSLSVDEKMSVILEQIDKFIHK